MKTPLKESTANIVLAEIQPDFGPLTTPTKPKEISQGEPWTPTANLKMLISAVSPEIRNRDQKRGLFNNRNGLPKPKDCLHVGLQRTEGIWGEEKSSHGRNASTIMHRHPQTISLLQSMRKIWTPSIIALRILNFGLIFSSSFPFRSATWLILAPHLILPAPPPTHPNLPNKFCSYLNKPHIPVLVIECRCP